MTNLLYNLGQRCFRRWRVVVALWVALVSVAGLGALAVGKGPTDVFRVPGVESYDAYESLLHRFPEATGAQAQIIAIAHQEQDLNNPRPQARVREVTRMLAEVDQVTLALDPWSPLLDIRDTLTDDHRAAMITLQLGTGVEDVTDETRNELIRITEEASTERLTFVAGGGAWGPKAPTVGAVELLGVMAAFIVLLIAFGSLIVAGLPLLSAAVGLGISFSVVWAATYFVPITSTGPFLALMIGLAVGIDYSLFILTRYRDELASGRTPEDATARAVATAGSAVSFAGATVVVALVGLAITRIPFLVLTGLSGALAAAIAVVAALTFTPAMCGALGTRLAPKRSGDHRVEEIENPDKHVPLDKVTPRGISGLWVNLALKYPHTTTLVVGGLLVLMTIPALSMRTSLPDNHTAPDGSSQREVWDFVEDKWGPGYNTQLVMTADLIPTRDPFGAVAGIEKEVLALENVHSVPLATPNPPNGDTMVLQVIPESGPDDAATRELVDLLRGMAPLLKEKYGVETKVTGITAATADLDDLLRKSVIIFGALVLGLSLLLLMTVFRSITVPIMAVIHFLLSLGATYGAVTLVFQEGYLSSIVNPIDVGPVVVLLPIILLSVLFGLSIDYEVFLVSRVREEYLRGTTPREAVRRGYLASARTVSIAAIIMIAVFGAFTRHGDATTQPMAFGLAFGVFIDAFLVRVTLLPAMLSLLGDLAWYMPKWLDHRLPSIDIEGEALQRQTRLAGWPYAGAHGGVHADQVELSDRGKAVFGPISFDVAPGKVLLIQEGQHADAKALALSVAGRMKPTGGILKVARKVVPEENLGLRAAVSLTLLDETTANPVASVQASITPRSEIIVVDGLCNIERDVRDEVLREIGALAREHRCAAVVPVTSATMMFLSLSDVPMEVLSLATGNVTERPAAFTAHAD
ncbi:MAG TPA: MMPL family transporter [Nocardioidaceae bacterium]|nr:MMPL family transporter [Nocardioidaceae bacterium]